MIDRVLRHPEFREHPPVLVDIGASGAIHPRWKRIAKYSIYVGFDPDHREMSVVHNAAHEFHRFHVFAAAASDVDCGDAEVHLTSSPFCSSLLPPDQESLADWTFADLFAVTDRQRVQCRRLSDVLLELNLDYVDWFQTDSQGCDLRLFQSLGQDVASRALAVELEPGFIDAYIGEDKLPAVLAAMDRKEFWLAEFHPRGVQRLRKSLLGMEMSLSAMLSRLRIPVAPCWAEMLYLNTLRDMPPNNLRSWMLAWVFATTLGQHGFAMEVAQMAHG